MTDLQLIQIDTVQVSADRARSLDPAWVEALAGTIEAEGLLQPIAVRPADNGFELVAGWHRLSACQALSWETIPAVVICRDDSSADLLEALENLARRELSALDRARHLARFKQAYEAKYPEAKRGGDRKSQKALADQTANIAVWSFADAVAEATGFSDRTIRLYAAIWAGLDPKSYERLCALSSLANNQAQLKLLSEQSHDLQDQVLGILEMDGPGTTVSEALTLIGEGRLTTKAEKKLSVARGAWGRLNQDERFEFLSACEEEVRLYAIQKGWIDG